MSKSIFDVMIDGDEIDAAPVEVVSQPPAKLDIDATRRLLMETFGPQVEYVCALAENFKVQNDDDQAQGIDLASDLNKLAKHIEAEKKKLTQEARDYTTGVNGVAKYFTDKIDPATRTLKQCLMNYQRKKDIAQAEAERKAREEQERIRKQLEEEAKAKGVEINLPPTAPEPPAVAKTATTRTASGASLGTRKDWKCTGVKDITKVPAEFLQLNTVAVNAAIKAGRHEIEGLIIEQVETPVLK
jgi:hypothetical protein